MELAPLFRPNPGPQTDFLRSTCRTVGYGGAAGGGKLLCVKTPVLTPGGWSTMGDLAAGDTVYDERGEECRVTKAFDYENPERAFLLVFDDGSEILAGEEHLWVTFDAKELAQLTKRTDSYRERRRSTRPSRKTGNKSAAFSAAIAARNSKLRPPSLPPPAGTVRTTGELSRTLLTRGGRRNHAIAVTEPIVLAEKNLPLNPYLLGVWLGNGTSLSGSITSMDMETITPFYDAGFGRGSVHTKAGSRASQFGILGLRTVLRKIGVFGDKHIPEDYLLASREQRLALLQGLMDTDGTVCDSGSPEFTNTNKRIIDGVYQLIVSLGWKASVREGRATLYGKDCGPAWDIKWTPDEYVFRLERKRKLQKLSSRRVTGFRYLVSCEQVPTRTMRCISVDSPSHLYLAGRSLIPTHNSEALQMHHQYILDFEHQRYLRGEIKKSTAWCIYLRRVMPNLKQSIARAITRFPLIDKGGRWNAADHVFTYSCGMTMQFGHCEKTHDWLRYASYEFTGIYFDELTEFEEEQFDGLSTRLRTADPLLRKFLNIRWASNPIGQGLLWVRRRFVEIAPPNTIVRIPLRLEDGRTIYNEQIFIPAFLRDNPYLAKDGQYEAALRNAKPHLRRALLEGDWYVSAGAFLADFWKPEYHVCENHKIPPNVYRFRSGDFGIAGGTRGGNTSISWWYVDHDGAMTCYHNLYTKGHTSDRVAKMVREIETFYGDWDEEADRSMLTNSPLDAQCFKRSGTSGPTIAEDFWRLGVTWRPSAKDRFNGAAEVCKRLSQFVDMGEGRKKPMIRWMKRCEKPIQILPVLPSNPDNPGDIHANHCEDDVYDDLVYACSARPLSGMPRLSQDDRDEDDLDELEKRRNLRKLRGLAGIG